MKAAFNISAVLVVLAGLSAVLFAVLTGASLVGVFDDPEAAMRFWGEDEQTSVWADRIAGAYSFGTAFAISAILGCVAFLVVCKSGEMMDAAHNKT